MSVQSILGPSGTPMVELGGERAWLQRVLHGFVCSFQWLQLDGDAPEACMVLFREGRTDNPPAYVIQQTNAWMYATNKGGPTRYLVAAGFKAVVSLGMEPMRDDVTRVADIILEGLPDLVKMPSEQPSDLHVARVLHGIEATATVNGKTFHAEVL